MSQNAFGLVFAVFFFESPNIRLRLPGFPEEQHRRFGKGPLQIGIAHLAVGRAGAFPGRFFDGAN